MVPVAIQSGHAGNKRTPGPTVVALQAALHNRLADRAVHARLAATRGSAEAHQYREQYLLAALLHVVELVLGARVLHHDGRGLLVDREARGLAIDRGPHAEVDNQSGVNCSRHERR